MKISVFGLGYVGCVSLGCLAEKGHTVIGVDVQQLKVDLINSGQATIIEKDIDQIIKEAHQRGRIRATNNYIDAVTDSDISIICVGTPSSARGHLNLESVYNTARQIAEAVKLKTSFHTVIIRSTVLPGTNKSLGEIISSFSGKQRNVDFSVVSNPEFLREGTAVADYYNPAMTVIGGDNEQAVEAVAALYRDLPAPVEVTEIGIAEMIKYVNNSFHALKIAFANEVGNVCKSMGVDSQKLMDLFCKDSHLNISPAYLKPGFAYGGSCLPKDLKGMVTMAHDNYIQIPVLNSISESNEIQKQTAFNMILKTGKRTICLLGLSFKEGTDDLRHSPAVDLAERLIGKGYKVVICDHSVHLSKLIGANKAFLNEHLPHLSELITDNIGQAVEQSEVLVINHRDFDLSNLSGELLESKIFIDMAGSRKPEKAGQYQGLSW